MKKILTQGALAASIMLAAPPAAAQVGFQFDGLLSWLYGFDESRVGFQAGVHYDLEDRFQVGVLYVNKGDECCMVHSIEVPITYRHLVGEITRVLVGCGARLRPPRTLLRTARGECTTRLGRRDAPQGRAPHTRPRRPPGPAWPRGSVMRCSVPAYTTSRLSYSRTRSRCPTRREGTV